MSTTLDSVLSPNLQRPDTTTLVEQEVARVEAFYRQWPRAQRPTWPLPEFVHYAFMRHLPLIDRWGGWSIGRVMDDRQVSSRDVLPVLNELVNRWEVGAKTKQRAYPPLAFRVMSSPVDGPYCDLHGCHVPAPDLADPIWLSRNAPETTTLFPLGPGVPVPVRHGQTISKVVLNAVRRRYAGSNPTYVAFWEVFFETLGVVWASAKPYRIVLSAAPADFFALGTFGENSCYSVGGEWERAKLHLALTPNSFVVLVYRDDEVVGRAWGIVALTAQGAEMSNFYLLPAQQMLPGVQTLLAESLGWTQPLRVESTSKDYAVHVLLSAKGYAYVNNDTLTLVRDVREAGAARLVTDECLGLVDTYYRASDGVIPRANEAQIYACRACQQAIAVKRTCSQCDVSCCRACTRVDSATDRAYCPRCAKNLELKMCHQCQGWTSEFVRTRTNRLVICRNCTLTQVHQCARCAYYELATSFRTCPDCNKHVCMNCVYDLERELPEQLCDACARVRGVMPQLTDSYIPDTSFSTCVCDLCTAHRAGVIPL